MTNNEIIEIFKLRNVNNLSTVEIAKMFKIKSYRVRNILKRLIFKEVKIPKEYNKENKNVTTTGLVKAARFSKKNQDWHLIEVASKFDTNIEDLRKELNLIRYDDILKTREKELKKGIKRGREQNILESFSLLPVGNISTNL